MNHARTFTMAGCFRRASAPASLRAVSAAASTSAGLAPPSASARLSRIQMLTTALPAPAHCPDQRCCMLAIME